jgi:hypothetical protein
MENEFIKQRLHVTRRHFLGKMSLGLGSVALGSLLIPDLFKGNGDGLGQLTAILFYGWKNLTTKKPSRVYKDLER